MPVSDAADYRKRAQECLALAEKANAVRVRDDLLKMAAIWTKMADERDRKSAGKPMVRADE